MGSCHMRFNALLRGASLALLSSLSTPPALAQSAPISEVVARFANGQPFTGVTSSGARFRMTLNPNGTGTLNSARGRWRVAGNQMCLAWAGRREFCNSYRATGGGYLLIRNGAVAGRWSR
jgi:hypothetical protein